MKGKASNFLPLNMMLAVGLSYVAYIELSLHPRGKSYLIMMYVPFNMLLNLVF